MALVARSVGDHQARLEPQPVDQLDGVFDPLALDHPGGLENQQFVGRQPQRLAHVGGVVVHRGRGMVEIHHVGNHGRRNAGAQAELVVGRGVDHHMLNPGQVRREGHVEVLPDRVGLEMLALPEKIVVVGDGRHTGLADHLGQSQPQGKVQGDGQNVFRQQDVDAEIGDEGIDGVLEPARKRMDLVGEGPLADPHPEASRVDVTDLRVGEVGLGHQQGARFRPVEFAGHVKAVVTVVLQHPGPFLGLQGDAVGAGQAGRDNANVVVLAADLAAVHGASVNQASAVGFSAMRRTSS